MARTVRAMRPSLAAEREIALLQSGYRCVVGLDEVGRGPLAGPVVSAAVVLDIERVPSGLGDSKALTAAQREEAFVALFACAQIGIAAIPASEIDRINIRQASLLAMRRAFEALPCKPDMALVDGNDPPVLPCKTEAIVKGDAKIASIAAASIIAKVVRDRMMAKLAKIYPHYGLERNAGYATAEHRAALAQHGPTPFHRMSFAPLAQGELGL